MIFPTDLQTQFDHISSKGLTGLLDISVASDPNHSPECSWWPVLLFIIVPVERGLGGLAGNVECRHVGQRVKTTDIFYVGDMLADMSADMLATCPKNMSAAGR
jgi:hypothetical protein